VALQYAARGVTTIDEAMRISADVDEVSDAPPLALGVAPEHVPA